MKTWLTAYVLIPLAAYLLGSVPFGLILCKVVKGVDIREHGSRNIGATNAGRVCGWPFFVVTFLLDFGKGLAVVLGGMLVDRIPSGGGSGPGGFGPELPYSWLHVAYGVCAILGHTFPLYVRFKGGKAVATSFGVFVALAPWSALIALGVWLVVFLPLHYVSLASMTAAVAAPIAFFATHPTDIRGRLPVLLFTIAIAVLVIVRHRANIGRLLAGNENRITFRRKKES